MNGSAIPGLHPDARRSASVRQSFVPQSRATARPAIHVFVAYEDEATARQALNWISGLRTRIEAQAPSRFGLTLWRLDMIDLCPAIIDKDARQADIFVVCRHAAGRLSATAEGWLDAVLARDAGSGSPLLGLISGSNLWSLFVRDGAAWSETCRGGSEAGSGSPFAPAR